jgi:hypothetical protein
VNTVNYGRIADEIIRSLRPRIVLDAGCCERLGDALHERGVSVLTGSLTDAPDRRCDLLTCLNAPERLPEEHALAATDTVLFSAAGSPPPEPWLNVFAARGFSPDITYDASYAAPDAMLLRRQPALPPDVLQLFSECLRLRRTAAGNTRLQEEIARQAEDFEALRALQRQLMADARELSARVLTRQHEAAVSSQQLAELESRLRSEFRHSPDVSPEIRRIAAECAELRGQVAQLGRRTTELDRAVHDVSGQVETLLHSRVWRALTTAGGLLLRVTGRK